jgi:hypothetical protein
MGAGNKRVETRMRMMTRMRMRMRMRMSVLAWWLMDVYVKSRQ